jgi:hypothetical protein
MLFGSVRSSNSLCASLNRMQCSKTCLVHATSGISSAEIASIKVIESTEHVSVVDAASNANQCTFQAQLYHVTIQMTSYTKLLAPLQILQCTEPQHGQGGN